MANIRNANKNRVLIADDNKFIRYMIKRWLEKDAEVYEVAHGKDVREVYLNVRPQVVFLDIHMPGRSGCDVLSDIMDVDPNAFIIMVSSDSIRKNVMSTLISGAKGFISKPFSRETLFRYYHQSSQKELEEA